MSHSSEKSAFDRRQDQAKAERKEDEAMVLCKNLVYLHRTDKGGVLVQENEDLGGPPSTAKKTWLPGMACRFHPELRRLDRGDAVEVEMPKRLAVEKEMMYEEIP